jgi:hypothetical protein
VVPAGVPGRGGGSACADGAELDGDEQPSVRLLNPDLAEPDGQRHLLAVLGCAAVVGASHDGGRAVVPYVQLGGLEGQVTEVAVPVDPLSFSELVALLADGQEVIGE